MSAAGGKTISVFVVNQATKIELRHCLVEVGGNERAGAQGSSVCIVAMHREREQLAVV